MKKYNAFTLAEVLITLAIIGIIAALTLPTVQKSMGDELEVRKRKAYALVSQIVDALYNDDNFYPASNGYRGFSVTKKIKYNGETFSGKTKFCELFAKRFNKKPNTNVNCSPNELTFSSVDGMDWYLPVSDFNKTYEIIKFDVNGEKEPNCMFNERSCQKPDTFEYYLLASGKIIEEKPSRNDILFPAYVEPTYPTVSSEATEPTVPTTPTTPTKPTTPTSPTKPSGGGNSCGGTRCYRQVKCCPPYGMTSDLFITAPAESVEVRFPCGNGTCVTRECRCPSGYQEYMGCSFTCVN